MARETSHSVRISQSAFLKLWDLQLKQMRSTGRKPTLQSVIDEAIELLEKKKS